MSRTFSEKVALRRLGIPDFRHMTKDKVVKFMSLAPRMDPEVAKAAIDQFPEFKDMAIQMAGTLKEMVDKAFDANQESQRYYYEACNGMLDTLKGQLEDDSIDADERAKIRDNMMQIICWMGQKDSENKKFTITIVVATATVLASISAIAAAAVGVKTEFPSNDQLCENHNDNLDV